MEHEKRYKQKRAWDLANKEKAQARRRKYQQTYNLKKLAGDALRKKIQAGEIIRPTVCEQCHKRFWKKNIVADHYKGYERENWLVVQFICRRCDGIRRRKS